VTRARYSEGDYAPIRFALALAPTHLEWGPYLAAAQAAEYDALRDLLGLRPPDADLRRHGGCELRVLHTMAALAAATKRIAWGRSSSGVTYRNPALQIKEATQVDVISGGRSTSASGPVGAEREFKAFDIPFPEPKVRIRNAARDARRRQADVERRPAQEGLV